MACTFSACKHRVSGSLSLPSRGSFHLSLTVLCAIGHHIVFRLGRWSSRLPTGFLVSCGTLVPADGLSISCTGPLPSLAAFSTAFYYRLTCLMPALNPRKHALWFGLFPVRSPLLRKSLFIFSSSGYLDVSVPRVPFLALWIHARIARHCSGWVSPFGHLRINTCLQFPAAYRSLPRPSSAYGAMASTLCSL